MKLKVYDEIKGENVRLISSESDPTVCSVPRLGSLIGGAQPTTVAGPRRTTPYHIEKWGHEGT
jgi:hypothetical protein